MKEQILKIIKTNDDFYEGLYELAAFQENLPESERKTFWEATEDLAWNGTLHERHLALYLISVIKSDLVPRIVPRLVEEVDIEKEIDLLPTLLAMIWDYRYYQYRDFCVRVLEVAKSKQNRAVYAAARRCLIVIDWQVVIDDLRKTITKKDKLGVVDDLAFFRWKNNPEEWHRFWGLLGEEEKEYIKSLFPEINDRITNHYEAAARGAREARAPRGE